MENKTLFYDGNCNLCLFFVNFIKPRLPDQAHLDLKTI